jgi:hypothetical protein
VHLRAELQAVHHCKAQKKLQLRLKLRFVFDNTTIFVASGTSTQVIDNQTTIVIGSGGVGVGSEAIQLPSITGLATLISDRLTFTLEPTTPPTSGPSSTSGQSRPRAQSPPGFVVGMLLGSLARSVLSYLKLMEVVLDDLKEACGAYKVEALVKEKDW